MASVLDRYGIKEVADLTFYNIDSTSGEPTAPVLYIDTAKVSTIEQTAENVSARGGKGNPELVMWDYGKEITLSIEDALYSAKSLAVQYGNGSYKQLTSETIMMTVSKERLNKVGENYPEAKAAAAGTVTFNVDGKTVTLTGCTFYGDTIADTKTGELSQVTSGTNYKYVTGNVTYDAGFEIDVSANSFPGTYYITGDTFARSQITGRDEMFQFVVQKGKILAESNTLTLEAEGDPTVFSMNVKVLRPDDGIMMKLVQYTIPETKTTSDEGTGV